MNLPGATPAPQRPRRFFNNSRNRSSGNDFFKRISDLFTNLEMQFRDNPQALGRFTGIRNRLLDRFGRL